MTKTRWIRFATLLSLLALAVPAMALPRPCDAICDCEASCFFRCTVGGSFVTSCGAVGLCDDRCLAAGASAKKDDVLLSAIFAQPENPSTRTVPELIAQPALSAVVSQSH